MRPGKKKSFRCALALEPRHEFAGMTCSTWSWKTGNSTPRPPWKSLATRRPGDAYVLAREVQWRAARADRAAAREAYGRLCRLAPSNRTGPGGRRPRLRRGRLARPPIRPTPRPWIIPMPPRPWRRSGSSDGRRKAWRRSRGLKALLAAGGEPAGQGRWRPTSRPWPRHARAGGSRSACTTTAGHSRPFAVLGDGGLRPGDAAFATARRPAGWPTGPGVPGSVPGC